MLTSYERIRRIEIDLDSVDERSFMVSRDRCHRLFEDEDDDEDDYEPLTDSVATTNHAFA